MESGLFIISSSFLFHPFEVFLINEDVTFLLLFLFIKLNSTLKSISSWRTVWLIGPIIFTSKM